MARSATIRLNVQLADGVAEVQRLETSLEEVGVAGLEAADNIERGASDSRAALLSQAQAAERASQATRSMGRGASNTATQLGFELTQAAQDAQFGMAGVANQVPLIAEQFQRLQQQSGSTTGAMRKLMGTFFGGTGLIALGTLLPTLLPTVLNFFSSTDKAAEDAKKSIEDLAGELLEFERFELAGVEIGPATITPAIRGIRGRLTQIQQQRKLLEEQISERLAGRAQDVPIRGAAAAQLQELQAQSLRRQKQELQDQQTFLEDKLQALIKQRKQFSRQLDLQGLLEEATGQTAKNIEDEADAAERTAEALEDQLSAIEQRIGMQLGDSGVQRQDIQHGLGPRQSIAATRTDAVLGRTTANVARQMPSLETLQRRVIKARMNLDKLGQSSDEAFDTTQLGAQAAMAAMSNFSAAIARSDSALDALQRTAAQVLSTIGGTFLTQAIRGASVLGLSGGTLGAVGVGLGLGGGIIQSLEHGGEVRSPIQLVGEAGPELAMLPQGTQVSSTAETQQAMGTDQLIAEVRSLRGALQTMRVNMSASEAEGSINEVQAEDSRMGASIYSQTT